MEEVSDETCPDGYDPVAVEDETAPPLWARFYEIGTNKPIFADSGGTTRDTWAEITCESRTGYRWLVDKPAPLLSEEYPAWRQARQAETTSQTPIYVLPILAIVIVAFAAIVGLNRLKHRQAQTRQE